MTFDPIWVRREITAMCKGACGRKLRRVVKEYGTVNPFSRNEDGTLRSASEVRAIVAAKVDTEVAKQLRLGIYCKECAEEMRELAAAEKEGQQ